MDFNLGEQEKMIQGTARDFAHKSVRPVAMEIDRKCEFPFELAGEMGSMGYFGLPYPPGYGGAGAGYIGYVLVIEQLCRIAMVAGAIIGVNSLAEESIFRYGSEEQKQRFLVPLTKGERLSSFAFTEAATGSDPRAIETRARPDGDDFIISGQKQFVALAPASQVAVVFARNEKDEKGRLSAFIVDTSSPGYNMRQPCETLGVRGLSPAVIYLDDVRVPRGNLLDEPAAGYGIMLEAISVGKLAVAAEAVGVGQGALELALNYAQDRKAHGNPIAELLSIKWLLAEMTSRVEASRWLTYRAASLRDGGGKIAKESATAKLFASQAAVEVTGMAMQVHGAYGYMKDMEIERLYRDAKLTEIYEGVSEIQRVIIADHLLQEKG
ncbi:MAG TPA: acyl-CoA dehydrogenase family protein [Dehalococcoidia bacterium]|nr:acyl-CoA dehydrogenase family protein [Dehalococcoidia bacterium]